MAEKEPRIVPDEEPEIDFTSGDQLNLLKQQFGNLEKSRTTLPPTDERETVLAPQQFDTQEEIKISPEDLNKLREFVNEEKKLASQLNFAKSRNVGSSSRNITEKKAKYAEKIAIAEERLEPIRKEIADIVAKYPELNNTDIKAFLLAQEISNPEVNENAFAQLRAELKAAINHDELADKLSEYDIPGRADNEKTSDLGLLEGKDPLDQFRWAAMPGFGVGGIFGDRGSGKTFYIKQLQKEIPVKFYALNKENLKYEPKGQSIPKLIIVDDLHYAFEIKRLKEIRGEDVISDEEILDGLEQMINEAKEKNIKIAFVSSRSLFDLYPLIRPESQNRFLTIMKNCVFNADDSALIQQKLGESMQPKENILKLRESLDNETILKIIKSVNLEGVPAFDIYEALSKHKSYADFLNKVVIYENGYQLRGAREEISYYYGKRVLPYVADLLVHENSAIPVGNLEKISISPRVNLRSLFGLAKKFRKINRITLKAGDIGKTLPDGGIEYTRKEAEELADRLDKRYAEIIGKEYYEKSAESLLSASNNEEVERMFLEMEMSKE